MLMIRFILFLHRLCLKLNAFILKFDDVLENSYKSRMVRRAYNIGIPVGVDLKPGESADFTVVIDPRTGEGRIEDLEVHPPEDDFEGVPNGGLETKVERIN